MLDVALADELDAGENLWDAGADATWVHLLPDLAPDHVGWFGAPDDTLAARLHQARRTTVVEVDDLLARRGRLAHQRFAASLSGVRTRFDLIVLSSRVAAAIGRRPELLERFVAALTADAVVCVRGDRRVPGWLGTERAWRRFTSALGVRSVAELSTRNGTAAAAPAQGLTVPVRPPPAPSRTRARARRVLSRIRSRAARHRRHGPTSAARAHPSDIRLHRPVVASSRLSRHRIAILRRSGDAAGPPAYLARFAEVAGVDLTDARWAVAPPRGYRSQKVIFTLQRPAAADLVVKITQEPRFNTRLDNERRALELLANVPVADACSVPRLVFSGEHGGLLVVGETALDGEPFRASSTASAGCPLARDAVRWLTTLAVQTADPSGRTGTIEVPARRLAERYVAVFDPDTPARRTLAAHVDALADASDAIPSVFSHGDPGTWNLLVGPHGGIGFLDWENFEPAGVPAWDLLLFHRSFATFMSEAAGLRPTADRTLALFCQPGPFRTVVQDSFRTYADQLGLDRALLPPLLSLCWVHKALKEATRAAPEDRGRGRTARITARLLEDPDLLSTMAGADGRRPAPQMRP
jgi:hypothetical protein